MSPMESADHDRDVDRLDREIGRLDRRLDELDSHGSRGVVSLQTQVQSLSTTIGELKSSIAALRTEVKTEIRMVKAGRWQLGLAYVGSIAPLYAGILYNFLHH